MCSGCALMYCITLAPSWYILFQATCVNYKICIIEFFMQNKDVRCSLNLVNILKLELCTSAPNVWNTVYLIWEDFVWLNHTAVPELWTTQNRFVGMCLMRVAVKKCHVSYIIWCLLNLVHPFWWTIYYGRYFSFVIQSYYCWMTMVTDHWAVDCWNINTQFQYYV